MTDERGIRAVYESRGPAVAVPYLRILLHVVPVVLLPVVVIAQIKVVKLLTRLISLLAERLLRHEDVRDKLLDVAFAEFCFVQRDADIVRRGLSLPGG